MLHKLQVEWTIVPRSAAWLSFPSSPDGDRECRPTQEFQLLNQQPSPNLWTPVSSLEWKASTKRHETLGELRCRLVTVIYMPLRRSILTPQMGQVFERQLWEWSIDNGVLSIRLKLQKYMFPTWNCRSWRCLSACNFILFCARASYVLSISV